MFSSFVLKPLEWVGLVSVQGVEGGSQNDLVYFKTPLWREVLRLETDGMVQPAVRH